MTEKNWRIAIVGGGIGGLTLALALRERGIDATVYERTAELREVGAAVALSANATRLLDRFGLHEDLAAVSAVPTQLIFRDGRSGDRIAAVPVGDDYREQFGASFWGIHRAQLQRILSTAVGPGQIHLAKELVSLEDTGDEVLLRFADGSDATANLVVGADGARSLIRKIIVGHDDAIYSGRSGFRGIVPVADLPTLPDPRAVQFWLGPDGHLLHYPIGHGSDEVNFLLVRREPASWPGPEWVRPSEEGEQLRGFGLDGWHPAVREMLSAVPTSPRWALFRRPPLRQWSRGRVVLLGDAAHALVPHHGQGANQTIEDSWVLADCLAEGRADRPDEPLQRYQDRRRLRTRAVQTASYRVAEVLQVPDGTPSRLRDADLAGPGHLARHLRWIHAFDPVTDSGVGRR